MLKNEGESCSRSLETLNMMQQVRIDIMRQEYKHLCSSVYHCGTFLFCSGGVCVMTMNLICKYLWKAFKHEGTL